MSSCLQTLKGMLQTLESPGDETAQPGLQSFGPDDKSLASPLDNLCSPWPFLSHVVSVAFPGQSLDELEKEMV